MNKPAKRSTPAREPDAILDEDELIPEKPSRIDFMITFNGKPRPERIASDEEE